jgi:DNA-binding PucR family transcriptional regulator
VGRGTPHDEATVHRALEDAAGALRAEPHAVTERIGLAVTAAVPILDADDAVRRARQRSGVANIADVLSLLADPGLPVDSGVPAESLALATTLVRHGADPGDLVHAYLVAQNELWRAWMEELSDRLPPGPELLAALELSSARIFGRADFLVADVMRHVERERERWVGGALARRSAVLRDLLGGDQLDAEEASRALGYEVDRWVLAVVLWNGAEERDDGLEASATAAAQAAGAPRALTFAPGEGSLWAWIGTRDEPDVERVVAVLAAELGLGQRAALGTAGRGVDAFRVGHEEALHARRVAELGDAAGVVRYEDVEAVSLVSGDLDRLARFVERTLGGLTARDETTARLRETLLAWLLEGGNARRAAERVHAHKNTVLYRLGRAQRILGRPLESDRGELELALTALQRLGPRAVARHKPKEGQSP